MTASDFEESASLSFVILANRNNFGSLSVIIININFLLSGYQSIQPLVTTEQKVLFYHRYIEAFKFANGLKKHIRDPKFSSEKVSTAKMFVLF